MDFNTISRKLNLIVLIAFVIIILLATSLYQCGNGEMSENHVTHYKYKTDQYRNLIHELMAIFQEQNTEAYTIMVTKMNSINTEAAEIGKPLESDKTSKYIYIIDTIKNDFVIPPKNI